MIIYEATKKEFLSDVLNDNLVNNIVSNYSERIGKINKSEVRSWDNSMQYMYRVLSDSEIPDQAGVAIEFKIPYTSKRIDLLISGSNEIGQGTIVIVELKQWEQAQCVENKEAIVKTVINRSLIETTHPSYQAWSYATLIKDYNENAQTENIELYPCAYLHNYIYKEDTASDPLKAPLYEMYLERAPLFVKGEAIKLRNFIKRYVKYGDNKANLYKIEKGKIRPSKSLQDLLASMLKGNEEFLMIDDQKVAFETALELSSKAIRTNKKQVLIIEGGPGTGKSVLAINLLVEATNRQLVAQYVTKNAAPRNVYSTKLKGDFKKGRIDNLFKGSSSFISTPANEFDLLIADEAHRLNEKSGMFSHLGENQVKEIMNASKLSVFLLDQNQQVTLKDIGSRELIQQFAGRLNADVTVLKLQSQFRCNGSDGYLSWLDHTLGIRETANSDSIGMDYDFRVYTNPNLMFNDILDLNKEKNKARMVAGYCWDWKKESKNDSTIPDVIIPEHNFAMSWNLGNSGTWAIDQDSVNEIGCIHTCQGLEFDYVGVIIGEDLIFKDGLVQTDYTKRAKTDKALHGIKKKLKERPDEAKQLADTIIRNTYRTLMTRGLKGCFIYCTDKDLENYFLNRAKKAKEFYKQWEEVTTSIMQVAESKGRYQ